MIAKLGEPFMNMHNRTDDFDISLKAFQSVIALTEKDIPAHITEYYSAFQNLLQCMNTMDMRIDDYDFSTVQADEAKRAELFQIYQGEIQKVHAENLSEASKHIVKKTIEYLQQRVAHEVFKLNVKKDVIGSTFTDLTKKSVSKRVTYGVHNKNNIDYSPLQVTEL